MKLSTWLTEHITDDSRALRWFDSPDAEDRIVRCYKELLSGYEVDPSTILKTTRMVDVDESPGKVEVRNIAFYSLCAHHFLPFFGHVTVCYVPGDRILLNFYSNSKENQRFTLSLLKKNRRRN